ncbi:hypothetical protein EJ06DRAFT_215629 [Trichodelitschia bisporula]|uniref:Uncharacterized protein n=1 Tax=Trichodelitschia bisporula TaxID=703511 RepID=A0A6G1I983_9PEZI|nr:hypothetical protein EJ06DRAFT_215629 [Trichodelitschia bisporula]
MILCCQRVELSLRTRKSEARRREEPRGEAATIKASQQSFNNQQKVNLIFPCLLFNTPKTVHHFFFHPQRPKRFNSPSRTTQTPLPRPRNVLIPPRTRSSAARGDNGTRSHEPSASGHRQAHTHTPSSSTQEF